MTTKKFLLSWEAPTNAVATGYIIQYSQDNSNWTQYEETFVEISGFVTGLDPCENYFFRVAGINEVGSGSPSNPASGIMGLTPYAPIEIMATPYSTSIGLSWTMPNNGGCPITGNYIEYVTPTTTGTGLATSGDPAYLLSGLSETTEYTIRIAGINAVGVGPYSTGYIISTENPQAPDAPEGLSVQYIEQLSAPTGLSYISKNAQITLQWSDIDDSNSIPLSGYQIEYKLNNEETNWSISGLFSETSGVVSGLTNCSGYLMKVAGINNSGTIGLFSENITGIAGLPDAPYGLSATDMGGQTEIYYTEPNNNGSAITSYEYYFDNNGVWPYDSGAGYAYFSTSYATQTFTMSAVNNCGTGPRSTGVIVTEYMGTP